MPRTPNATDVEGDRPRHAPEAQPTDWIRRTDKEGAAVPVRRSQQEAARQRLHRVDVFRMIRRRAKQAGPNVAVCCHTFRATGITTYLDNGGPIENAQAIANHESPRTTKLYDRTNDEITLDEVERIQI